MASKKNGKAKDKDIEPIIKKEVLAYKYSKKGQGSLYEAIILCGQPCFITWDPDSDKGVKTVPVVEESTRIIASLIQRYILTPRTEFADVKELRGTSERRIQQLLINYIKL